jgi:carbonic anhydrase/acetyltransferase-like protein (isoleucine patch superfamily)
MILAHLGKSPRIDSTAYVAPNAVVCGDVTIGADCRILFGAQIIAEGGSIAVGCRHDQRGVTAQSGRTI